jgi:hypothetical protein
MSFVYISHDMFLLLGPEAVISGCPCMLLNVSLAEMVITSNGHGVHRVALPPLPLCETIPLYSLGTYRCLILNPLSVPSGEKAILTLYDAILVRTRRWLLGNPTTHTSSSMQASTCEKQ